MVKPYGDGRKGICGRWVQRNKRNTCSDRMELERNGGGGRGGGGSGERRGINKKEEILWSDASLGRFKGFNYNCFSFLITFSCVTTTYC